MNTISSKLFLGAEMTTVDPTTQEIINSGSVEMAEQMPKPGAQMAKGLDFALAHYPYWTGTLLLTINTKILIPHQVHKHVYCPYVFH